MHYVSRTARNMTKPLIPLVLGALAIGLAAASLVPQDSSDKPYEKDCYITTGCIDPQTGIMYKAGD